MSAPKHLRGRPRAVLAYIERGLDPDAPMTIILPGSPRLRLSPASADVINGQLLVLEQRIEQGKAEVQLLQAGLALKRQGERQVLSAQ